MTHHRAILAVFMLAFHGGAYEFMQPRAVWPRGNVLMEIHLGAAPALSDGRQNWDAVAEDAMDVWNSNLFQMRFLPSRTTGGCADDDGRNGICWRSEVQEPELQDAVAITWRWREVLTARVVEADIFVNSDLEWDSYRGPRCDWQGCTSNYDLRRVLLHELGHVIGLDHEDDVASVMGTHVSNVDRLTVDDIAGAHVLYPAERVAPWIFISSPASGAAFTGPPVVVRGTAGDDSFVSRIVYRINGGLEGKLTTRFAPMTTWSMSLNPRPGTNRVRLWSVDSSGNMSLPQTTTFLYVTRAPLTVLVEGSGSVTPDLNGKDLQVGRTYELQAVPETNYLFVGWRDETRRILSSRFELSFAMRPELVLTAQFVANPFPPLVGTYSGLFYPASGLTPSTCGSLRLTLGSGGSYTAVMKSAGTTNHFSGKFNPITGKSHIALMRNATALELDLALNLSDPNAVLDGTVNNATWQADVYAPRLTFNSAQNPATNFAGHYTVTMAPGNDTPPMGFGYATATINLAGKVSITGRLPDAQAMTYNGVLSESGACPVYLPLYGNRGVLIAWIAFDAAAPVRSEGSWVKRSVSTGLYRGGFTNTVPFTTSRSGK